MTGYTPLPPSCMKRPPWNLSSLKGSPYVTSLFEFISFAKIMQTLSLRSMLWKNVLTIDFPHYFIDLFCCFILYRAILSRHPIGIEAHGSKKDFYFKQVAELRYNS